MSFKIKSLCLYKYKVNTIMTALSIPISKAETDGLEINPKKLNAWLLENMRIMEELTVVESSSWREVDTPG